MKKILFTSAMAFLALYPIACTKQFPLKPGQPLTPTLTVTATATVNQTPVCGFTSYSLGTISLQAQPNVIRSAADWQNFYSHGTGMISLTPVTTPVVPAPPVDFTQQMLIVLISPVCPSSSLTVTNVCEGPAQITVSANNVQACVICNVAASWGLATAIAVPQSNLPIVWNTTQVPCQWPATSTPTPSPTP